MRFERSTHSAGVENTDPIQRRVVESLPDHLAQRSTHPVRKATGKAHLVDASANTFRNDVVHRQAQGILVPPAPNLPLVGQAESEVDEAIIEKGKPRFDA